MRALFTREAVLSELDDYAATGDHEDCTAAAREWSQKAAEARAAGLPTAGWLQRIARAHELRAVAIQCRLGGRMDRTADALDYEKRSEDALGRGPHDVLTPRETDRLINVGMAAFWAAVEDDQHGQWLVTDDGDGPDVNDTEVRIAARNLFRKLAHQLADGDDR